MSTNSSLLPPLSLCLSHCKLDSSIAARKIQSSLWSSPSLSPALTPLSPFTTSADETPHLPVYLLPATPEKAHALYINAHSPCDLTCSRPEQCPAQRRQPRWCHRFPTRHHPLPLLHTATGSDGGMKGGEREIDGSWQHSSVAPPHTCTVSLPARTFPYQRSQGSQPSRNRQLVSDSKPSNCDGWSIFLFVLMAFNRFLKCVT